MRTEQISLLKADPDLGALLAEPRRAEAERRLLVSTHRLGVGPWDVSRLSGASADHIGLLVLEGVHRPRARSSPTTSAPSCSARAT